MVDSAPKSVNDRFIVDSVQSRLIGPANVCSVWLNGSKFTCLLDTGSVASLIPRTLYDISLQGVELKEVPAEVRLTSATGDFLHLIGYVEVDVQLGTNMKSISGLFLVYDVGPQREKDERVIIGTNLLESLKGSVGEDVRDLDAVVSGTLRSLPIQPDCLGIARNKGYIVDVPAMTEQTFMGVLKVSAFPRKRTVVATPLNRNSLPRAAQAVPVLFEVPANSTTVSVPVRVRNCDTRPIRIPQNCPVYNVQRVMEVIELPDKPNEQLTQQDREFIDLFDLSGIPEPSRRALVGLLLLKREAFALSDKELGRCSLFPHRISLTDEQPFKEKYRRIPPQHFDKVKLLFQEMLDAGVIRHSFSPWASTVTIATKKSGEPRICVDYRRLNGRTIRDSYGLPRISDTLDSLCGAKVFSSLDLLSGYWQCEVDEASKLYTAFTAGPLGFYEWNRLPFGLINSGATFQRTMERVLKDLLDKEVLVYIDDVVIFSKDVRSNLERLTRVFDKLIEQGLRLKPSKCKFLCSEISYLGHSVSGDGIRKDPDKLVALDEIPEPNNVKELRRFIGLVSYFRKFVPHFAERARPLTDLLRGYSNRKGQRKQNKEREKRLWHWGEMESSSFQDLKNCLKNDVCLKFADYSKDFVLQIDASRSGLGACLLQSDDSGELRPISFASRRTSDTEVNYPAHKLEFLALKWAVTDKFKDYLTGSRFVVRSDSNPLLYVMKSAVLDAVGQRWCASLADYDFTVEYKPGVQNRVADCMSRVYAETLDDPQQWRSWAESRTLDSSVVQSVLNVDFVGTNRKGVRIREHTFVDEVVGHVMSDPEKLIITQPSIVDESHLLQEVCETEPTPVSVQDWGQKQRDDPVLSRVIDLIQSDKRIKVVDPEVFLYLRHRRNLRLDEGVLYHVSGSSKRVVVPPSMRRDLFKLYHGRSVHAGTERTHETLRERFFWPRMYTQCAQWVSECMICLRRKRLPESNRTKVASRPETSRPFEIVAIDFLSVDSRARSRFKILTVVDEFSRYAFAIPVRGETAKEAAKKLFDTVFTQFGFPEQIHSDQGKGFVGRVFKELLRIGGVKQSVGVPHNPRSNAITERVNQTFLNLLGTLSAESKSKWHQHLNAMTYVYNTTVHETTGETPFYLMFLRKPRLPVDFLLSLPSEGTEIESLPEFLEDRTRVMAETFKKVMDRVRSQRIRHHMRYDRKLPMVIRDLKSGDIVLIKKHYRLQKLDDRWEPEPYVVVRQPNTEIPVYEVRGISSGVVKVLHRNHLLYVSSEKETERPESVKHKAVCKPEPTGVESESESESSEDEFVDCPENKVESEAESSDSESEEESPRSDTTDSEEELAESEPSTPPEDEPPVRESQRSNKGVPPNYYGYSMFSWLPRAQRAIEV